MEKTESMETEQPQDAQIELGQAAKDVQQSELNISDVLSSLQGMSLQCGSDSGSDKGQSESTNDNSSSQNSSKQVHGSRTEFIESTAAKIAEKMEHEASGWDHAKLLLIDFMT